MALTLELPSPVGEELAHEAEREGVSETDRAALFVCLAAALLHENKATPFQDAVKHFLAHRALNTELIGSVIEELVTVCLEVPIGQGKTTGSLEAAMNHIMAQRTLLSEEAILVNLRGWRDAFVHQATRQTPENMTMDTVHEKAAVSLERDPDQVARVRSIRGKYARTVVTGPGSEELHQERQRDKQKEEAWAEGHKR